VEPSLVDIGLGGMLALLIIREVFGFLRDRKEKGLGDEYRCFFNPGDWAEMGRKVSIMSNKVDRIHEMHDVKDIDGTYIWYMKSSLVASIDRLAAATAEQGQAFRELVAVLRTRAERGA